MAQKSRFGLGVIGGITLSQIEGDDEIGYKKLGFTGGLEGIVFFKDRFFLSMDLLFTQKGSRATSDDASFSKIRLNYIEVPVVLNYLVAQNWDGDYKIGLQGGLSYGRLIDANIEAFTGNLSSLNTIENRLDKEGLNFIIGANLIFTENIEFTLRHTLALSPVYSSKNNLPNEKISSLNNFHLSFFLIYKL